MKIVIDARESGTTTGRYVDKLIEHLHKIDNDYEFVLLTKKPQLDYLKKIALSYKVIETPYKEFSFGEQLGFKKQIQSLKPDLVHFPMVQQPIFYRGKVVTTMQDLTGIRFRNPTKSWLIFTIKQSIYKIVNWYAPRHSKKVIVPTNYVKNDVINYTHAPASKFVVTHEAADTIPDKAEPLPKLVGKHFLLYTGRPMPHKNLPGLIKAFTILKEKNPDLLLVLAGKKDLLFEKIESDTHKAGIKDVIFPGFVSEGELRWLYENCQVYVFPSFSEGFGLPGLEAMTLGAPVASSNATCLPEVHGNAAEYFNPADPDDMAKAIQRVLSDKHRRAELIKLGYLRVKQFSWDRMAKQTLEVYKDVLS